MRIGVKPLEFGIAGDVFLFFDERTSATCRGQENKKVASPA